MYKKKKKERNIIIYNTTNYKKKQKYIQIPATRSKVTINRNT